MTIHEKEQQIIEVFEIFADWTERYDYLIELGKSLPAIDEQYKTEQYLIQGCQSQVWIHALWNDGIITYTADSDAIITKGIIALLIDVLSGNKAEDILQSELNFINKIGLKEHLSPTRANGLLAMIKQMKLYALAYKTKYSKP